MSCTLLYSPCYLDLIASLGSRFGRGVCLRLWVWASHCHWSLVPGRWTPVDCLSSDVILLLAWLLPIHFFRENNNITDYFIKTMAIIWSLLPQSWFIDYVNMNLLVRTAPTGIALEFGRQSYLIVLIGYCYKEKNRTNKENCTYLYWERFDKSKILNYGLEADASTPSLWNNLISTVMHPCVTFFVFSVTSTPNWIISPDVRSKGWLSSLLLPRRLPFRKVPFELLVSWI